MTTNNISIDNVETISASNVEDLFDYDYDTEKFFRTGIESKCKVLRLKDTGEVIQYDYQDKRSYNEYFQELDPTIGERLVELGLVHPGSLETDNDLKELIASVDYRFKGSPESVSLKKDDIDSEDGE